MILNIKIPTFQASFKKNALIFLFKYLFLYIYKEINWKIFEIY
jgi:hypothetical protein